MLETSTLAILAGGKGSRLGGAAKGLLEIDGEPIIQRLVRLAASFADALLITPDPAVYAGVPLRAVSDLVSGRGAPGGVHAALAAATTEQVFVVACDMPFVTAPVLRALDDAAAGAPLAAFEVDGRLEPLLGRYRSALAPAWERLLARQPSFRELFGALGGAAVPERVLRQVDPERVAVVSLNTPDDLRRWRAALGSGRKAALPTGEG